MAYSCSALQQPSNSPEQELTESGIDGWTGPRPGHTYWYVHDKRNIQTPGGSRHFLSLRQVSSPANS